MKAFVLGLSAISLALALPLPTAIISTGLDRTIAVASRVLSSQAPAQLMEPSKDQSPTSTQPAHGEPHGSLIVNAGHLPENITVITDKYLFRLSIEKFEAKRESRRPSTLDWSSDGCTKAPDDIGSWNFLPACHRHDFGIRNYRKQGRLNKTTKGPIDDQFLEE